MWDFICKFFHPKRAKWDSQYNQGKWQILKSPQEEERFRALANLVKKYTPNGNILEIGCGEGLLLSMLENDYISFIGVDISSVAVKRAQHLSNDKTKFIIADMEKFKTNNRFDVIIFNESIYYAKSPLLLLKRYKQFLSLNGVIATSIFDNGTAGKLRTQIACNYDVLASQTVINKRGTWHCEVFR